MGPLPVTAKTPVYGLEYLVQGEPARAARLALENNAKTIEAALILGGIAPPEAQNLAQLAGRVTTVEGKLAELPVALPYAPGVAANFSADLTAAGALQGGRVWRVGRSVFMAGLARLLVNVAAGSETTVATLPAAYRPKLRELFTSVVGAGIMVRLDVHADGSVKFVSPQAFAAPQTFTLASHWTLD